MNPFHNMSNMVSVSYTHLKNAIVLVDQIDTETAAGKAPREAVISATTTRIVPVLSLIHICGRHGE